MPARDHAITLFILVCRPDSHKTLYEWVEGLEPLGQVSHVNHRCWTGKQHVTELLSFQSVCSLADFSHLAYPIRASD